MDGGGFYTFNCAVIVPGENTSLPTLPVIVEEPLL